jgi:hypothetical protein
MFVALCVAVVIGLETQLQDRPEDIGAEIKTGATTAPKYDILARMHKPTGSGEAVKTVAMNGKKHYGAPMIFLAVEHHQEVKREDLTSSLAH